MSGINNEDIEMSSPSTARVSSGGSVSLDRNTIENLLETISQTVAPSLSRLKFREPDLFHGERSAVAVSSWLSTLESYYELANVTDIEKYKYAVTLFRGDALLWWNRTKLLPLAPHTWHGLREALITEFSPRNSEQAARDRLAVLYQRTTVTQYIREFRTLHLQIPGMSSGDALDRFVRGLQPHLRVAVRSRFPDTLHFAESLALAIEGATEVSHGRTNTEFDAVQQDSYAKPHLPVPTAVGPDDPMDLDTIRQSLNALARTIRGRQQRGGFQRYDRGQDQRGGFQRSNRGQMRCFACQGYGHMRSECPTWRRNNNNNNARASRPHYERNRSLNAVIQDTPSHRASVPTGELVDLAADLDALSLNKDQTYLLNVNQNKDSDLPLYSFDLYTKSGKRIVKVLLDTGASSNYISSHLVHDAMKVIPLTNHRQVETAGGHTMRITKKVEFMLGVQGLCYTVHAYVFDTKFDIILGQHWFHLAKPSPIWSTNQWRLGAPGGVGSVLVSPCAGPGSLVVNNDDSDVAFVISKKQLQRYAKQKSIEEIYLIHFVNTSEVSATMDPEAEGYKKALLHQFKDVFCDDLPPGLPPIRTVEHVIDTGDASPVSRPPFKMSPLELDELRKQLDELLSLGLIRPSSSPWGAPVLFVRKKDGKLRMCIDYRAVNALTRRINTPLPRIDECLERLGGAKYFSSLDLKSGYHQVRIREDDVAKTAFNTRYGSYEFLVLPFGLTNSPPTFQRMMNDVLKDYIDKFALVYLDDILIFSKSIEEHSKHLHLVMEKLRSNKLFVNNTKCSFFKKEVEFLGYCISAAGILPSQDKIRAIRDWPQPTNVQEVRQFIGLCSHYRRFVPGFSSLASPLTDLTKGTGAKKRAISWTNDCGVAFSKLKRLMTSAPVLVHPDLTKPFVVETDASDVGTGAVLLQHDENDRLHPVAYESKKLSPSERSYPIQERELLAVLLALRSWRCFLEGSAFVVYTDHNPLQYLRSQVKPTPRLVRWLAEIELYNPTIKYKPGKDNGVPDALSRVVVPSSQELNLEPRYLYASTTIAEDDWPLYYNIDIPDNLPATMKDLLAKERDKFFVKNNQVWRKIKLGKQTSAAQFCPRSRRADLVARFHEGFGHIGKTTVFDLLRKRWWWSTMPLDIANWLASCPQCQLASGAHKNRHSAPMVPSDVPAPFSRWHLDFVGELPLTKKGNRWLLTAVDFTTNWPIARAVPAATAETVADFIYEEIVMRFGCPAEIVTDRGANFMSKLVQLYCQRVRINHKMTSAFHPRTNGKCERFNGIIKTMLRKYVHGAIHMWDDFVDAALFACRVRKHRSAGVSPFFLVYGREPVLPGDFLRPYVLPLVANDPRTIAEHTARELEELGQVRAAAAKRMMAVAEYDKQRWDAAIDKLDFEIGDHVLLRNEQKYGLEYNWFGPFLVVDKNENINIYKLVDLGGVPYSSWVHVDRLKAVKAETIDTPWYNPAVSRAAWRSEMGLSGSGFGSGVGSGAVKNDQRRSSVSVEDGVVMTSRRFRPRSRPATKQVRTETKTCSSSPPLLK